jgi:hypothetical protein
MLLPPVPLPALMATVIATNEAARKKASALEGAGFVFVWIHAWRNPRASPAQQP